MSLGPEDRTASTRYPHSNVKNQRNQQKIPKNGAEHYVNAYYKISKPLVIVFLLFHDLPVQFPTPKKHLTTYPAFCHRILTITAPEPIGDECKGNQNETKINRPVDIEGKCLLESSSSLAFNSSMLMNVTILVLSITSSSQILLPLESSTVVERFSVIGFS